LSCARRIIDIFLSKFENKEKKRLEHMEIALHVGAHLTDDGRVLRCLVKNRELLFAQGIEVPAPGRYRDTLLRMASSGAEGALSPEAGQMLLDDVLDSDETRRLVLSEANMMAWKSGAVRAGALYPMAGARMAGLRDALADHQVGIFLAIRNPASLLPALLPHLKPQAAQVLRTAPPENLRWAPLVAAIRRAWPEAALTVWCDEDTPFIWHRILQAVSGQADTPMLEHTFDWFDQVMVDGGAQKLEQYLRAAPPVDDTHRQRVIAAFLDKYYDPAKVEEDVAIPEWDAGVIDRLTALYEEDVDQLAGATDVTMIQP
jgi:hypothetical protein